MDNVEILPGKICKEAKAEIRKVSKYTEQVFRMYGGRTEKVTLQFDKKLIGTIYDKFGEKTKIKKKTVHVQGFINHLMEIDPMHGSATNDTDKLSPSTVRRYLTVLQSIFKQAEKLEIIAHNPAKGEKLTIPRVVNPKIEIFTKAEAAEMLKCLTEEDMMFQTFVQLAIITGARRGELAALKFSDFDFDRCHRMHPKPRKN